MLFGDASRHTSAASLAELAMYTSMGRYEGDYAVPLHIRMLTSSIHLAATLSLVPFNVAKETALSFAILAHLVNVVPVSLIGAAFLMLGREQISLNWRSLRGEQAKSQPAEAPTAT